MALDELAAYSRDARARTLALIEDLSDAQLVGPRLPIVNPLGWEIGHVAWFQEKWVLRDVAGEPPRFRNADALYDSSAVPHDTRWDLPLPTRAQTVAFLEDVLRRVLDKLPALDETQRYFARLAIFHEDMHDEAFTYTRQTHGFRPPSFVTPRSDEGPPAEVLEGDAQVPGGKFLLGAREGDERFVFDNEKWAHEVEVKPFAIARAAVTQGEFARFVEDRGYQRKELWSEAGQAWRAAARAEGPVYWRRDGQGWLRRDFDREVPLEPRRAMIHVNAFEAEAFCAWAGRRLPTELEWEVAAAGEPTGKGGLARKKRRFPWGDAPPDERRANLDWRAGGCLDVGALPDGDSAFGCRQMIGNVWEWTASPFQPYPGFVADPYADYSQPWFGTHRVLRGGCWTTRARLLRNTWRNFYTPDRRDVWAGFRTCAPATP
jgi:iron(II)-dependent oxidoreductase